MVDTRVNSVQAVFKLDTGAVVTATQASLSHCVSTTHSTNKSFKGVGNNDLEIIGVSKVTVSTSSKYVHENVYAVKNLVTPPLGKPAISKLSFLSLIDELQIDTDWKLVFPKLFRGLGTAESG